MSLGINKVILVGTLYSDPMVKAFGTGGLVANFMVVTKGEYKDKVTGESKEYSCYHKVSTFGRLAEFIREESFKKEDLLLVEGSLRTRKYKNKEGVDVYVTEIIPFHLERLASESKAPQYSQGNLMPHIEPFGDEEIPF